MNVTPRQADFPILNPPNDWPVQALTALIWSSKSCRPFPEKETEQMIDAMDAHAMAATLKKLDGFLDQLDRIPASPVEATVADWKSRLAKVTTRLELASIILELEADINDLGSGLPSGKLHRPAKREMCHVSGLSMLDAVQVPGL